MEKLIRPCNKEYMRITMLKHQDTFKEHVYELHRLYRIQNILMKNMEATRGAQQNPKLNFDLERPAKEDMAEADSDGVLDVINETEIELTLRPLSYKRKKVETPLTSDLAHSLSFSSTGSSLINKTRLKTRHSSYSAAEELSGGLIGLVHVRHLTAGDDRTKQPPWFFQVLSLNTK
ncbi:hypothetical protein GLYMA_15G185500v4 [Glycine max]|uniref:Uncharacterized protein n=2 Tax=Glycine subgen. Soja TaxID=1462606 RepID=A0A0R0GCD5_SOYBN|nr:hypothetical protein GLYMA_15G185500v4 [Glycine max]RZB65214.1 hypothetical protein D0Y65_041320 [Glycine soja]